MPTTFETRARLAQVPTPEPTPATSKTPAPLAPDLPTFGARLLANADPDLARMTLEDFSDNALLGLRHHFPFWAMPHQLPPEGDWRTWVCLGGRGAGKTRAGAEWVRAQVEGPRPRDPGKCTRIALLGETLDEAREVMVMGDSGILACSPPDRRPTWHATRRMLEWPNGATAQVFSASDPESLRGPQFDGAWADELGKWKKGQDAWDMLQFGLRLGHDPRCVVTTTPRSSRLLLDLVARPGTVETRATTFANKANLAPGFLAEVQARFQHTRLGCQELEGLFMEETDGALWTPAMLDACRADFAGPVHRVVVAVDPAVSMGRSADATGIVVVGISQVGRPRDWHAWVLEDATVQGASPDAWGRAAISAANRHNADRVVAEVNQGGAMVEEILRGIDPAVPYRAVRAEQGKSLRAEPVAALYERGLVHHPRGTDLAALEDQMTRMTASGWRGKGSPDRLDALVWALHDGLIQPARAHVEPTIRSLA